VLQYGSFRNHRFGEELSRYLLYLASPYLGPSSPCMSMRIWRRFNLVRALPRKGKPVLRGGSDLLDARRNRIPVPRKLEADAINLPTQSPVSEVPPCPDVSSRPSRQRHDRRADLALYKVAVRRPSGR